MNRFCGYKTAIFKVLDTYYKKDNPFLDSVFSANSANFVLLFFNDFPKIWDMLTSSDVYNYKVLNDKRMVSEVGAGYIPKEYVLRHLCDVVFIYKKRDSKLQNVFDNVNGIYQYKETLPKVRKCLLRYTTEFDKVIDSCLSANTVSNPDSIIKYEIKRVRKEIDVKTEEAVYSEDISILDRGNINIIADFFEDLYISYYTNKKTQYMDKNFTTFPAMSKFECFLYKVKNIFRI